MQAAAVFTHAELEAVRETSGACQLWQPARRLVQQAEMEEKAVIAASWPEQHRARIAETQLLPLFERIVLKGVTAADFK